MADKYFLDSNVVLYAVDDEDGRTARARELLFSGRPIISAQVLNEFVNVAGKKFKLSTDEISTALSLLKARCETAPVSLDVHERAWEIFCSTKVGMYDANIIAAAELSGCDILYTEDMHHGQRIGRVSIVNPFLAA